MKDPARRAGSLHLDILQGADVLAPGLSRAQLPLLRALKADESFTVTRWRFHSIKAPALFPYMYGPLALRTAFSRAAILHVANAWYAHVVPLAHVPTLVTCYDLVELQEAETASYVKPHRRLHYRALLRGLRRADAIVCTSQATARAVLSFLPQVEDRLSVIYPSLSPTFLSKCSTNARTDPPYVLYVGSEQPRKNIRRLVEAVAEARRTIPELRLVKVGGHQTAEGRATFWRVLEETGLAPYTTIREQVSDEELRALYEGATLLWHATLREGFGYPPLEAMARGCPVLVSDRDSLPEVTGGAALVVDPTDVRDMARAIERLTRDAELRSALTARGRRQVERFGEAGMIEAYKHLYRRLARSV